MDKLKHSKIERVLGIYTKLMNGYLINKAEEATNYGVNERSIQRDVDDIRSFLEVDSENMGFINSVIYDRIQKGYHLEKIYKIKFTNSEVLAVCKILLESRAFTKKEMNDILEKLISFCVPKINQRLVLDLIANEKFHYVEPRHKTQFLDLMWEIGMAIRSCKYIEIDYYKLKNKTTVKRKVKPVAIMFSEYYFYVTAFIVNEDVRKTFDVVNDSFPTIYRIDRIKGLKVLDEKFYIPYSSRFEDGKFRKQIQFMHGGKLQNVKFKYSGLDIDSILDRFPTAKILKEEDDIYTLSAEVFEKGINMWLKGQGENIELL